MLVPLFLGMKKPPTQLLRIRILSSRTEAQDSERAR